LSESLKEELEKAYLLMNERKRERDQALKTVFFFKKKLFFINFLINKKVQDLKNLIEEMKTSQE